MKAIVTTLPDPPWDDSITHNLEIVNWHIINIGTPHPDKYYLFYDDQTGNEFKDYGNTTKPYTYFKEIEDK